MTRDSLDLKHPVPGYVSPFSKPLPPLDHKLPPLRPDPLFGFHNMDIKRSTDRGFLEIKPTIFSQRSKAGRFLGESPISFSPKGMSVDGPLGLIMTVVGAGIVLALCSSGKEPDPRDITPQMMRQARDTIGYSQAHVNIAVVGRHGMGKSTFVNCVRGGHGEQAATGATETTMRRQGYADGLHPRLRWYDVPGGGTRTTSEYLYYYRQLLYAFDVIVLVHDRALSPMDEEVVEICQERSQTCLLVRSMADIKIGGEMRDKGLTAPEARARFVANVRAEPFGPRDHIVCWSATRAAALGEEAPLNECEQFIDELALLARLQNLGAPVQTD